MFVLLFVFLNSHIWYGLIAAIGRIIVACPDFGMVGQREKPTRRSPEVDSTAAGEVAACGANVCMENRITTEYVV